MITLGFDTTSSDIFIVLINGNKKISKQIKDTPSTEYLLPEIDKVLRENNLKIGDVDVIATCVGPGSFTGSRVGVVTAKALAVADTSKKIIAFSAFDAINMECDNLYVVKGFSDFVYIKLGSNMACEKIDEALKLASKASKTIATDNYIGAPNYENAEYDILKAIENKLKNKEFVKVNELEPLYLRASQAEIQLAEKKAKEKGGK